MKITLIYFLSIFFSVLGYSQVIEHDFNTVINESVWDLFELDGNLFYSINIADENDSYNYSGYHLVKADLDGNFLDSLTIISEPGYMFILTSIGIDNKIYLIQFIRDISFTPSFKIYRISSNLDIEICKEYTVDMEYIATLKHFITNDDMIVVLEGYINGYTDYVQRNLIIRFDENCDTICSIIPDYNQITNVISIPNETNYYIGTIIAEIIKVDSNFNIIDEKFVNFCAYYQTRFFWPNNYPELVIVTNWAPDFYIQAQIEIIKTDTSFNIEEYEIEHYGDINRYQFLGADAVFKNPNNGYFIASWEYNFPLYTMFDQGTNKMTIRNYSNEIEFQWERIFSHPDTTYFMPTLLDVGDGFILGVSKFCRHDSLPNLDAFLYKFNYNGNYHQIFERTISKVMANVYPSPGNDYLILESYFDFIGCEVKLYDNIGREVTKQKITQRSERINTALLTSGTYIYNIVKKGELITSGKWIKEK